MDAVFYKGTLWLKFLLAMGLLNIALISVGQEIPTTTDSLSNAPFSYFTKSAGCELTNVGGNYGSSWGDFDNDGDLDVIAFQSSPLSLFRNNCNGCFTREINNAISSATSLGVFSPAQWIDYDNDGDLDMILYQAQGGFGVSQSAMVYKNDGSGNFAQVSAGELSNDTLSPRSISVVDYDNDGNLDIFVSNRNRPNVLYRSTGTENFTKVTGSLLNSFCTPNLSQGSSWGDYDNDGDMDVYIGGGGSFSCFYANNGDGSFTQINNSLLTNVVGSNYGPAWVDYDNDSDLDLFLQIAFSPNLLFMNNNNGIFTKVTVAPFLIGNENAQGGPTFGDYDNDGDLDLFLTNVNGHVNKFYVNNGDGTFTENKSEIITNDILKESSAATFADADNDGDLDLYVTNFDNPYADHNNFFYKNNASSTASNWFKVKCIGAQTNKQAIGARVYLKAIIKGKLITQMREINGNCNLTGGGNGVVGNEVHFGLGNASSIQELKIVWPKSGIIQKFTDVSPNQFINITEGQSEFISHLACAQPPIQPLACENCIGSFRPEPGKAYVLNAWVKEANSPPNKTSYTFPKIILEFPSVGFSVSPFMATGSIIDGWQRVEGQFTVPSNATDINIKLLCTNGNCFFDDIRVFPYDGSMKSYVYDPLTLRLAAELDERNYATIYEYDEEGKLTRVKKETERGVMTIKESKTGSKKR